MALDATHKVLFDLDLVGLEISQLANFLSVSFVA
jgi:hypothetical protein